MLYAGCICWVIGYDSIYALQDRADDALIGIKSSALRMGRYVRPGVGAFYAAALLLWRGAIWQIRPQGLAVLALLPVALQLMWQVATLKANGLDPFVKFRSNRIAGLLMFLGCLVVGSASPVSSISPSVRLDHAPPTHRELPCSDLRQICRNAPTIPAQPPP